MIAVGGDDGAAAVTRLQVVLAHQPSQPQLLAVEDDAVLAKRRANPAVAVAFELIADRPHPADQFRVRHRLGRDIILGGPCETHQPGILLRH
jgi:hypothetical protein